MYDNSCFRSISFAIYNTAFFEVVFHYDTRFKEQNDIVPETSAMIGNNIYSSSHMPFPNTHTHLKLLEYFITPWGLEA